MLYLKANTDIQTFDNFKGEQGKFIKTFAFNTKRNKNGWRVTWDSVKKRISDFLDKPGIEFVKCEGTICDLDHTEGATFEQSLEVQEDFRVTNIIDYILDENTETAFFIHKSLDDAFFDRVKNGEIKAVSPSVWPIPGEFVINGENENGLPKIDVFDWRALHDAFVNKPAFGDDAKITATCEGENCHMKLLSAKELQADDDTLAPLQDIPLLVRHKNKLRFVSVSKCVADKINSKIKAGEILDESLLIDIINEIQKNSSESFPNTSFSSCQCSGNHHTMTLNDDEIKKMQESAKATEEKVKELESKLKAVEDEKEKLTAKLKAAESNDEDDKLKEAKATTELLDKENKDLKAKVAEPIILSMLKAREQKGATESQLKLIEKSLRAKSISDLEERFNDEQILMNGNNLSGSEKSESIHFDFNGTNNSTGPLSAKSLETVFDEEVSQ